MISRTQRHTNQPGSFALDTIPDNDMNTCLSSQPVSGENLKDIPMNFLNLSIHFIKCLPLLLSLNLVKHSCCCFSLIHYLLISHVQRIFQYLLPDSYYEVSTFSLFFSSVLVSILSQIFTNGDCTKWFEKLMLCEFHDLWISEIMMAAEKLLLQNQKVHDVEQIEMTTTEQ